MAGTIQMNGQAKVQFFEPILASDLRIIIDGLPSRLLGIRDKAVLLVAFLGKFQRAKLSRLDRSDVTFNGTGMLLAVRGSKKGMRPITAISRALNSEYCAVRALEAWLMLGGINSGPLFRRVDRHGRILGRMSPEAVAIITKRAVAKLGLDPAKYAAHSLRAGGALSSLGSATLNHNLAQRSYVAGGFNL